MRKTSNGNSTSIHSFTLEKLSCGLRKISLGKIFKWEIDDEVYHLKNKQV